MKEIKEKIIYYDSPEAAKPHTMQGWLSAKGFFYKEEHMARYDGCTHRKCEGCDGWSEKMYTHCGDCRNKRAADRYNALPFKEWDLVSPICAFDGYKYFFSEEDLTEYLYEEELKPEDLQLVYCRPNYFQQVDGGYWEDILPENADGELPSKLEKALAEFNKVISELKPASWSPDKIRTSYTLNPHSV